MIHSAIHIVSVRAECLVVATSSVYTPSLIAYYPDIRYLVLGNEASWTWAATTVTDSSQECSSLQSVYDPPMI